MCLSRMGTISRPAHPSTVSSATLLVPSGRPADRIASYHLLNCRCHVTDILNSHTGVDGERHYSKILTTRHREVASLVSICFSVIWMEMQGNEMNACADLFICQLLDKGCAVTPQPF